MGRKIFVSYKYRDNDVKTLLNVIQPTWPCDYVDYIRDKILKNDDIYIKAKIVMKIFLRGVKTPFGII